MPSIKFMNSDQEAWFDEPRQWQSDTFPFVMKFNKEKMGMENIVKRIFSYLSIQDMEAFYIGVPPMRETTFSLMQSTSLRWVRFIVEKQISERFMNTLYDLIISTDTEEMDHLWSRCWEHWKLIVDALDLKTNFLINFSGTNSGWSDLGCRHINWKDPAGIYQTNYEVLSVNILVEEGEIIFSESVDEETGERLNFEGKYSFCAHLITNNAAQVKQEIQKALTGPLGLMAKCRIKYSIEPCGQLLCDEDDVNPAHKKLMREFVSQGILTEKQLAKRESPIYNDDGHLVKPSNRERMFYCTDCMSIHDGYGTRQSSANGIIVAWPDNEDRVLPTLLSDIVDGNRFRIANRQHTCRPSTANAQLFRRGRLTFGNPFESTNRLKASVEQEGVEDQKNEEVPLEWRMEDDEVEEEPPRYVRVEWMG